MTPRKFISTALLAVLPVALAACSSSKSGSAAGAAGGPSAGLTQSAGSGKQLTGTQLAAALLSGTDVPAGFSDSTSSAVNTGDHLSTAAAKYKPATISCADLLNQIGEKGFGESAMADDDLTNQTSGELINEAVYQFSSATAANVFFTSLDAKWNSCGTFTESASSGTAGKVSITAASAPGGLGQMAFANTMSATASGTTLNGTNLAVLEGDDVLIVGPGKIGGGQPADLSAQALMQKLMSKLAAAG